jgi:hypothetical protein
MPARVHRTMHSRKLACGNFTRPVKPLDVPAGADDPRIFVIILKNAPATFQRGQPDRAFTRLGGDIDFRGLDLLSVGGSIYPLRFRFALKRP